LPLGQKNYLDREITSEMDCITDIALSLWQCFTDAILKTSQNLHPLSACIHTYYIQFFRLALTQNLIFKPVKLWTEFCICTLLV